MAPVALHLRELEDFEPVICSTGQHRQMLDAALNVFQIQADVDLNVMKPNQDLTMVTCAVLEGARDVLKDVAPDIVLVQGDTTTTFAMSVAAFYQRIPVGHVEAGLRTYDKFQPYPEEVNRMMTTSVADLHFPPTESSRQNLLKENVADEKIWVTGNTVIDALLAVSARLEKDADLRATVGGQFSFIREGSRMVLMTGHRRENFGEGIRNICDAVVGLADRYPDVDFVYPVHLNPRVREPVMSLMSGRTNVHLIEPVDYLGIVYLMGRCHLVLTDSGGIQEEAPSLGRPVLVMRERTERPEGVEAGTARLVGTSAEKIQTEVSRLLDDEAAHREMSQAHNPYGDGKASARIAEALRTWAEGAGAA